MALFFRFVVGKMSNFVGTLAIVFSYSLSLYLAGCCCCWTQLISYSNGVICQKRTVRNKVALHNVWSGQFVSSLFHSLLHIYVVFLHDIVFWEKTKVFSAIGSWWMNGETAGKEFVFPQNHHAATITLNIYFIIFTFSAHDVNLFGLFCFVFTNRKIVLSLK